MSKRTETQLKIRKQQKRNQIVIAIATIVVFLLVIIVFTQNTQTAEPAIPATIEPGAPAVRNVTAQGSSLGDPNAPVKVDVWEDFQCPGCRAYSQSIEPQIVAAYVATGKVYYTFHVYPFVDGGAGESQQSANAALCAAAQERFWDYHDLLFANWKGENVGSFTDERLIAMAESLKLDMEAFKQCFSANAQADKIAADKALGKSLGVPPTPGIFVNNEPVISSKGPNYIPSFEDIAAYIEKALNEQ